MRMIDPPSRVRLSIDVRWATWSSCERMGFTTVFSNWRADVFSEDICTVISGMAMSGRRDTGSVK